MELHLLDHLLSTLSTVSTCWLNERNLGENRFTVMIENKSYDLHFFIIFYNFNASFYSANTEITAPINSVDTATLNSALDYVSNALRTTNAVLTHNGQAYYNADPNCVVEIDGSCTSVTGTSAESSSVVSKIMMRVFKRLSFKNPSPFCSSFFLSKCRFIIIKWEYPISRINSETDYLSNLYFLDIGNLGHYRHFSNSIHRNGIDDYRYHLLLEEREFIL